MKVRTDPGSYDMPDQTGAITETGLLMLHELRGRNLAHVGCTVGLTLGLVIGLVVAIVLLQLVPSGSSVGWATFAWFGLTFALGVVGYYLGGMVSRKLWGKVRSTD